MKSFSSTNKFMIWVLELIYTGEDLSWKTSVEEFLDTKDFEICHYNKNVYFIWDDYLETDTKEIGLLNLDFSKLHLLGGQIILLNDLLFKIEVDLPKYKNPCIFRRIFLLSLDLVLL